MAASMTDFERHRAIHALGRRAIQYYIDTGECVFCDADDLAARPHESHCDVGELSGVELTEERLQAKASERARVAEYLGTRRGHIQNPMCDGAYCIASHGEARLLPTGAGGNLIVCRACFHAELTYRRERNQGVGCALYTLPSWESLEVYEGAQA